MLPGFSGLIAATSTPSHDAPIQLAGIWSTPGNNCVWVKTNTFCTGAVLWCQEMFLCGERQKSETPYPCGVCVGVSDPSDW